MTATSSSSAPASVRLILNTALLLTALGMVVRAAGAVKEVLFARAFGVSADTDAFVLASTYATFVPMVLAGSIGTALIAERARGGGASADCRSLSASILIAAAASGALMYLCAPLAMERLFSLEGGALAQATEYARVLSPLGFATVMSVAMAALLNSEKQFYVPGMAALATPAFTMLAILAFADDWGVSAAAWGTVAGALTEVAVLAARVGFQTGRYYPRAVGVPAGRFSAYWRAVAVLSIAGTLAAISPMIDQAFLARMQTGAISNYNYASKVNSLLIALFGTAFGAAIYPYLSDHAARRDVPGLKRLAWQLSIAVLPATALVSAGVYAFSYEIVDALFARGNFTPKAAAEVSEIQQVFAVQLVFYVAGLLAMRVLNAAGASRMVLAVSAVGVVSNAFFDWLFYESLGARGIALASVITSVVSLVVSVLLVRPALGGS